MSHVWACLQAIHDRLWSWAKALYHRGEYWEDDEVEDPLSHD